MSCVVEAETPTRWKKLTTWEPDCSHDISCHSSENWHQRNGDKPTLELKTDCAYDNQDDAGQTTCDQFQDDCQSWPCCFCKEPMKAFVRGLCGVGRELSFGQKSALLSRLPASKIKLIFLSTSLACFSSVQFSSSAQSCTTLCNPINHSMPGFPVHHQLLESTQTHIHWVSDAIQLSHPLLSPSPPALNLSQHQGLFRWVSSLHQVAKVLEFQLQHQPFQWTPRTDLL